MKHEASSLSAKIILPPAYRRLWFQSPKPIMPRTLVRIHFVFAWDYRTLVEGIKTLVTGFIPAFAFARKNTFWT
jgi:hypothetical protein